MNPPKLTNGFFPFKLEKLNKTVLDSNEENQKKIPKYASILSLNDALSPTKNDELEKTYHLRNSKHLRQHIIKKENNKQHHHMKDKHKLKLHF